MMNWCRKHECFEICPECNREREIQYGMQSTVADRHPKKIIIESNPGTPPDPRTPAQTGDSHDA